MSSIKVKFRPSSVHGKLGTIYYQIIRKRIVRQLKTDYRIFINEWDKEKARIIVASANKQRCNYLISLQANIERDLRQLKKSVSSLESKCRDEYTADDIIRKFRDSSHEQSFFSFMESIILQLKRLNRQRTMETYIAALHSFLHFQGHKDLLLEDINTDLMLEYEAYLKARGVVMNTVSFYMRILRAVYNRAVEKEMIIQCNPFKYVYTGVDKTVKRALTIEHIRRIKELDLMLYSGLDFARDIFLFSFYTRGMSFIDMAYLKKSDIKNGILSYRRRKTGQQLFIKWEKCMQDIVDKYGFATLDTPFLLPIITTLETDKMRKQYKSKLYTVNFYLKRISKLIGLRLPLTTYVARHSWASIAKSKNIPISVISEGMGHDSEATTQIYLKSLEYSLIDRANSFIINDL